MPELHCRRLLALISALALLPQPSAADQIDLKVVKYGGLAEEVRRHAGKVVLVDFWSIY